MLGYSAGQFPGTLEAWAQKVHPDDFHKIIPPQASLVASPRYGDTFECTYRLMRADDTWAWILGRGFVTHRDKAGRATRLVGLHTNITATQGDREQLENQVSNDALTGLRSRSFLNSELERLEKSNFRPVGVITCDVNGLKLINDYLGHAVGDKLLRDAALVMRLALRATDCVARMGGDEFTILLPACPPVAVAKILQQLENHFNEHSASSTRLPVLMAFGTACAEDKTTSLAQALIQADRNMIQVKNNIRSEAHLRIKKWIEQHEKVVVSLEDSRYF